MVSQIELLGGRIRVRAENLLARCRAEENDVVIVSGTLLEGIGNLYSDLDLYVIGDRLPPRSPNGATATVVREDGRVRRVNEPLESAPNIVLDVQYYTFRELATLARSLNELYAQSRLHARIFRKTLHADDEDLIHKLFTGLVLQDRTQQFDAHKTFDAGRFCFLKYRNEVGGYAEFRDLIGSWEDGDLDSCLYNIRGYLISQVSGMMFLAGSTNPRPKWFVRRLASLGEEYLELRERILVWMYDARHTTVQKREAVETACDLIDMTYAVARSLLGTQPQYFAGEEALALVEAELGERARTDQETSDEAQLLRGIFGNSAPCLFAQIEGRSHTRPGVAA